jgi:hypothetical protein
MNIDANLLVTVLVALFSGGAISGFLSYLGQRSKNKIDLIGQVNEMALKLLAPYQMRVDELEEEIKKLKAVILRFQPILNGANQLYLQVKGMSGEPIYIPPTQDEFEAGPKSRRNRRMEEDE